MKEGWTYKKLGECIDNLRTGLNPRTHFKLNTPDATGYYITVRELCGFSFKVNSKTDRVNDKALKRINERSNLQIGDVLYSGTGTIGKTALVTELPTWWNIKEGVYAITPKHDILDSLFLIYLTQSEFFINSINSKTSGTTVKSIPMKEFVGINIPVPPLSEQQSIVAQLDEAFAEIDLIKSEAEKQLSEAKALFQKALSQAMTPKEGWEKKKISEVGDVIGGTTPSTSNPNFWNGDICWISPAELHGERYLYDSVKKITKEAVKAKSLKELPEGTVILSSRAPIGKVAINKVPMYCNQGFKCVICRKQLYNEFLYWWFYGNTDYLNSLGTGATFSEISKTVVENISIPLPPLSEQQRIVEELDELSENVKEIETLNNKLTAECDAMKQALLRQVFE